MFANRLASSGDAEHRFRRIPELPVTWQGFTSKGPVEIGANHLVRRQLRGDQRSQRGGAVA